MMDSISSVAPRRANAATKGGNVAATGSTPRARISSTSRIASRGAGSGPTHHACTATLYALTSGASPASRMRVSTSSQSSGAPISPSAAASAVYVLTVGLWPASSRVSNSSHTASGSPRSPPRRPSAFLRSEESFCVATCTGQHDEPLAHFLHPNAAIPSDAPVTSTGRDAEGLASSDRGADDAPSDVSARAAPAASSSRRDNADASAHSSSTEVVTLSPADAPAGPPPRPRDDMPQSVAPHQVAGWWFV